MALMAADHRGAVGGVRALLGVVIYPLQQIVHIPLRWVDRLGASWTEHDELVASNARLQDETAFLNMRLLKYAALEKENIRLRGLLDAANKLEQQVLVAELLAIRLDPYQHVVTLNKGAQAGIQQGQPVMDEHGVAGQVLRTTPFTSEVILITDPNHAIPVQVNRNGLLTIANGGGLIDQLVLPYLPNNADIQVGDLLVTSGLGGVFPAGYPVATVTRVEPQSGQPFSVVMATPLASLDRSRELLIAQTSKPPVEAAPPEAKDKPKDSNDASNKAATPPPAAAKPVDATPAKMPVPKAAKATLAKEVKDKDAKPKEALPATAKPSAATEPKTPAARSSSASASNNPLKPVVVPTPAAKPASPPPHPSSAATNSSAPSAAPPKPHHANTPPPPAH